MNLISYRMLPRVARIRLVCGPWPSHMHPGRPHA